MSETPIYLVTDIEADGLTPGINSMLGFATVAIGQDGTEHGAFTINLQPLDDARQSDEVMAWWRTQPEAWAATTHDPRDPEEAIPAFVEWAQALPGPRVFTAHPLHFDGRWIASYMERFAPLPLYDTPYQRGLTIGALDLPTLVMGIHGWPYEQCSRRHYPESWLGGYAHSHRAIDDARGYAHLLRLLLAAHREHQSSTGALPSGSSPSNS